MRNQIMQKADNKSSSVFLSIALELYKSRPGPVNDPQSIFPERRGNVWKEISAELRNAQMIKRRGIETR